MTEEYLNRIDLCKNLLPAPAPEVVDELVVELRRYRKAIDKIYNHNESAKSAVIEHFGIIH